MALPIHPSDARFEQRPEEIGNYTMVTCTHPYHGHGVLYFSIEEYHSHFIPVTRGLWANGFTILVQPMD